MLRPIARYGAPFTLTVSVALVWLFGGCRGPDVTIAESYDAGAPPAFVEPDAEAPTPELALTEYCPLTTCPMPFATCPTSRFPCDVNLMTDPENCGSCGFDCGPQSGNAVFDCVSGKCAMRCTDAPSPGGALPTVDCNGIIDDDCEVMLGTNENCNGCGDKCPDPDKPCIYDRIAQLGRCGCEPGRLYCGTQSDAPLCADPTNDDNHCGGCGNACDPAGGGAGSDGGAPPTNMHYGCTNSECGHLKCDNQYGSCDGDLSNGCETSLLSNEHCGACDNACAPGQTCRPDSKGKGECVCPPGLALCGNACVNLTTDPKNCGACGNLCSVLGAAKGQVGTCAYGYCVQECRQGWGDCNGDPSDGCEVNLSSDQNNCGTCGNACDVLAGQPCVGGQCAVHPCSEGEEETR